MIGTTEQAVDVLIELLAVICPYGVGVMLLLVASVLVLERVREGSDG